MQEDAHSFESTFFRHMRSHDCSAKKLRSIFTYGETYISAKPQHQKCALTDSHSHGHFIFNEATHQLSRN